MRTNYYIFYLINDILWQKHATVFKTNILCIKVHNKQT